VPRPSHNPSTHNRTTLQQKKKTWHDLAGHYGLEDMMTISPTIKQAYGVKKEFDMYSDESLSPPGTDLLGFWGVQSQTDKVNNFDILAMTQNFDNLISESSSAHRNMSKNTSPKFFPQAV
jgi:hypothetical protein